MQELIYGIKKIKDDDGHWYWIPNQLVEKFNEDLEEITGIEYMDNPEKIDEFIDKYSHYRTCGDSDIVPDFFKN